MLKSWLDRSFLAGLERQLRAIEVGPEGTDRLQALSRVKNLMAEITPLLQQCGPMSWLKSLLMV